MKEKTAYEQSREMLTAAYKSLSGPKQEHAANCYTCNGSGTDTLTPPNQFKICPTCKGSTSVIVMR